MLQTWLRDAVLAGLMILGLAFGLEHASEVEAVGRKLAEQAQTALAPARPASRVPPARPVTSAPTPRAPLPGPIRRPRTSVVQVPESRRRMAVRVIPPVPPASSRMGFVCPDRCEPSCGWQWIPVANCNRW